MLDEDAPYRLHQRLEAPLGPEEAGTLMASRLVPSIVAVAGLAVAAPHL